LIREEEEDNASHEKGAPENDHDKTGHEDDLDESADSMAKEKTHAKTRKRPSKKGTGPILPYDVV
jgi:hypothetical protein